MRKRPILRLPIQGLLIRCLTASDAPLAAACPLAEPAGLPSFTARAQAKQTAIATALKSPANAGESFNISDPYYTNLIPETA